VSLALGYCDGLLLLQRALAGAQEISLARLRAGVDQLATSFESPMTFATHFAPGRHDGAAAVRMLAFDGSCTCFVYRGGLRGVA
jgi:hypothetical protein